MAQEDNYKEGVDFEYVQGNGDDNSNFKTRHFFTKAEKEARKNPKPAAKAAPKAATKPKAKSKAAPKAGKITVTSLNPDTPPGSKPAGMPGKKKDSGFSIPGAAAAIAAGSSMLGAGAGAASSGKGGRGAESSRAYNPNYGKGKGMPEGPQGKMKSTEVGPRGNSGRGGPMLGNDPMFHAISGGGFGAIEDLNDRGLLQYKKGGMIKEGTAKDMREDKAMAKKSGMSMKKWESSAADVKHDAPNKMSSGGIAKRGMGVTKKATGGSMRGTGCAVRGKGYSGSY